MANGQDNIKEPTWNEWADSAPRVQLNLSTFTEETLAKIKGANDINDALETIAQMVNELAQFDIPPELKADGMSLVDRYKELLEIQSNAQKQLEQIKTEKRRELLLQQTIKQAAPHLEQIVAVSNKITSHTSVNTENKHLSEVIEKYLSNPNRSWTEKSKLEVQSHLLLFQDIVGDKIFREIRGPEMNEFQDILYALPANINKIARFRSLSPREIVKLKNVTPRSVTTANKTMQRISSLFEFAMTRDWADKNYAKGRAKSKKSDPREDRDPFTKEELEKLFLNNEILLRTGKKRTHSYYFWLPLIGLFTGARINEICQLYLDDFQFIDGVPCILFNDEEEKRLKNKTSKRTVPIHDTLIKLGLLNRIEELRKINETRLFPELRKGRDGHSQAASKWFGKYRRRHGVTVNRKKTFHSFRHTLLDRLQKVGVPEHEASALSGHSSATEAYKRYGKGYGAEFLKGVLRKFDPEIDLSPLMESHVNPWAKKKN